MSAPTDVPQVACANVARAVARLYGVRGEWTQLAGERDLNFLLCVEESASAGAGTNVSVDTNASASASDSLSNASNNSPRDSLMHSPNNSTRNSTHNSPTAQRRYIVKIVNRLDTETSLICQQHAIECIARAGVFAQPPTILHSLNGNALERIDVDGERFYLRITEYIDGRVMAAIAPARATLLQSLGEHLARMDIALDNLADACAPRELQNDLARPLLWRIEDTDETIARFAHHLHDDERELIAHFQQLFCATLPKLRAHLRVGAIHNDANDHNIIVAGEDAFTQRIVGIIDFGDMAVSWRVAEPAIAAGYAMLTAPRPLDAACAVVRGYHRIYPLRESEIESLFALIGARLSMSVCICAHQKSLAPRNDYLRVSERAVWRALRILRDITPRFAECAFRDACELEPVAIAPAVVQWLRDKRDSFHSVVDADLANDNLLVVDASVGSATIGAPGQPTDVAHIAKQLTRAMHDTDCSTAVGRYDECRLIYDANRFADFCGHPRTLHLGVDLFISPGAPVFAPLDGIVRFVANENRAMGYGGVLVLAHRIAHRIDSQLIFYTLYGHLAPASIQHHAHGDRIERGAIIAQLGGIDENGGWPPHLHFQLLTDLLGQRDSFLGVGTHHHRAVWLSACPNPNLILNIPESKLARAPSKTADEILAVRNRSVNPSLRLSYRKPLHFVRGAMQYLFDASGRAYLDAVNNVAHVGHCHPRVVAAERAQAGLLNTNTRYLTEPLAAYAERLLQFFPPQLSVCYFVNSGAEANDLALRLARNFTARRDIVVLQYGYHGALGGLIDASHYKHAGVGGDGAPDDVHVARLPVARVDVNSDVHCDANAIDVADCLTDLQRALQSAAAHGGAAALLTETLPGCAGQVVLPDGYLRAAYRYARDNGALCIADEVQVGFGRLGAHFWGFESQQVTPDIVTLGKPIGNGHPIGAVVTTRAIADAFNNGMEYFNTFGGNSVSCAIGCAVLDVIESERLQQNASQVGGQLIAALKKLQTQFDIIVDVRGIGLFIGVELQACASAQAEYIVERMKEEGVLLGVDGPLRNVLKIKPPLCFNADNAAELVAKLAMVLGEGFARVDWV